MRSRTLVDDRFELLSLCGYVFDGEGVRGGAFLDQRAASAQALRSLSSPPL